MDSKSGKVLDNGQRVVIDLKRKHSGSTYSAGATGMIVPLKSSLPLSDPRTPKRNKLDGSGSFGFPSGRRLIKYYSNFKKSGILQRLLYYQNDEWNDFPENVVAFVNQGILAKNPAIEVQVSAGRILLDFLHMVYLNMDSGLLQPIAWIDVGGNCFFPEVVGDSDKTPFESQHMEGYDLMGTAFEGRNDINLHLEIQVHTFNDECSGESVAISESVKACENAIKNYDDKVSDSSAEALSVRDAIRFTLNEKMGENMNLEVGVNWSLNSDAVTDMFYKAIKPDAAKIVQVRACEGVFVESHLKLFKKQVKLTKKYRGDANLSFAWFPCPKGTVSTILKFGIENYKQHRPDILNGAGIHLIPANGNQFSINNIDVDENGTRHVVLCRVIMGNMEVVPCGSEQSHPSGENFDSGVDKLQNPSCYVVWSMNINSHIHPDCIVSFKVAPEAEGAVPSQEEAKVAISSSIPSERLHFQRRIPKSTWMPFGLLFASISNSVSPQSMESVRMHYELFKSKSMSRDEFIKKLRLIVGDGVLKSAITGLRQEITEPSTSIVETS